MPLKKPAANIPRGWTQLICGNLIKTPDSHRLGIFRDPTCTRELDDRTNNTTQMHPDITYGYSQHKGEYGWANFCDIS